MFSHVGYDAYNAVLDSTRADFAAAVGDDGGATRVALMQSATDGLNTLVAGLRLEPNALVVTTAEEHGSALLPVFGRRARGDRVRVIPHVTDDSFLDMCTGLSRRFGGARDVVVAVKCKVLPVAEATLSRPLTPARPWSDAGVARQYPVDVRAGADAYASWIMAARPTRRASGSRRGRFESTRFGWRSQSAMDLSGG